METLAFYRTTIRTLLLHYASFQPAGGDIEIETILDEANNHYELMYTGWNGPHRLHGSVLHLDIRNNKIWIQYDGTSEAIAEKLVEAGIPHDQIVLAFKSPDIRPFTDFAVA